MEGVGLMLKHKLAKSVMDVRRISPRILSVDLVLFRKLVIIISVYESLSGKSEQNKNRFHDAEMQSEC